MTNHENREATPGERAWGWFLILTLGLYVLVMVIIPSLRFMNGL